MQSAEGGAQHQPWRRVAAAGWFVANRLLLLFMFSNTELRIPRFALR
jgi:hypothetical protein